MELARGKVLVDIVDTRTRSRMMANIKSRDTKPELVLRRAPHALGYRYRLCDAKFPGRPDLVFARYRVAIFVHGCFWHRHEGCKLATDPATRPGFWREKFEANVERDIRSIEAQQAAGWNTRVVWECELKPRRASETVDQVSEWLERCSRIHKKGGNAENE